MNFGFVALDEAEGTLLAHALRAAPTGTTNQSYLIPKGTVLTASHLRDLAAYGHEQVLVARLEAGDLLEDIAAERVARALVGEHPHMSLTPAKTGRVNVIVDTPGVLDLDAMAIHAANAVDPMVSIATARPFALTRPGFMAATIKIISYGVAEAVVEEVAAAAREALEVRTSRYSFALLIETSFAPEEAEKKSAKGLASLNGRLAKLAMPEAMHLRVAHEVEALTEALRQAKAEAIFVLTASATSDRRDIGPTALQAAGGTLTHFGMPVDPGNLLFYGWLGEKPVIGLPGCARSPALNGADWVMQRLLCGIEVTPADIAAMGVGGLLKEMPDRPQTREIPLK